MNDLSRLLSSNLNKSDQKQFVVPQSSHTKPRSTSTTLIDAPRLKRLRRDLIASKKALVALDCEFAVAELEKEKEQQDKFIQQQQSKEMIQSLLMYGFDTGTSDLSKVNDHTTIDINSRDAHQQMQSQLTKNQDLALNKSQNQRNEQEFEMRNQMIKRIVMSQRQQNDGSSGQVHREGDYSKFKIVDNKESANIKKQGKMSPMKDPYMIGNILQDQEIKQIRSISVIQSDRPKEKFGVLRFYNFEKERSKSKINQLLSQPIEIPDPMQSSFITEGYSTKRKLGPNSSLFTLKQASNVSLPLITNLPAQSRNQANSSTLKSNYNSANVRLPLKSDIKLFNESNNASSRIISNKKLEYQNVSDVRKVVTRPLEDEINRLQFEFLKQGSQDQRSILDSRQQKLRKLARDVSKEPNTFNRQKILFDLVDQSKDDIIGIKSESKQVEDPRKGSPLKNEDPNSSIIVQVEPTFPLKSDFDFTKLNGGITREMHDEKTKFQLQDIIEKKDLVTFSKNLPIDKNFEISNVNYTRKITDMNSILQTRINEVQNQCLNEDLIYANFQKQLLQQSKMHGIKAYSDKRFSDFDILVWPQLTNLQDHRNIKISKTGYQIDEENMRDGNESIFNSQNGDQFNEQKQFQAYSNMISEKRRTRHDKCLPPIQRMVYNPDKNEGSQSPQIQFNKESSIRKASELDAEARNSQLNFSDQDPGLGSQSSILQRKQSQDSTGNQKIQAQLQFSQQFGITPLDDRSPLQQKGFKSPQFGGGSPHQPKSNVKLKKKKKTKEQLELEREEELKRKAEIEHAEYLVELNIIKTKEYIESAKKFSNKKRVELETINQDIEDWENHSDDQFDIYQNNLVAQAYIRAKKKVEKRELKLQKQFNSQKRATEQSSSPLKLQVIPNVSVSNTPQPQTLDHTSPCQKSPTKLQQNIPVINISTPTKAYVAPISSSAFSQQHANQPQTSNSPIFKTHNTATGKPITPKAVSLDSKSAFIQKKAQEREAFNNLIVDVYQKNENVDYDRKMRKLRKRERRQLGESDEDNDARKQQLEETINEDGSLKAQEGGSSEGTIDSEEEMMDRQAMKDQFEKEEIMEQEMLKKKMADEKKANMQRKYLQMCKNERVLPLPIISKIYEGVLSLDDYKLNFGLCKALGNVLDDLGDSIFKIDLRNNGISDSDYAEIIKGAIQNPHIKSLSVRNNEFREESLKELLKYFQLKKPILEDLVISGCRTKNSQINELLRVMSDYNNLRTLAICQSQLDKTSVHYLADIANGNSFLRELDLSWNQTTSLNMWELVQNIEFCRHLSFLNLSFNSFVGPRTQDIVESLSNFIKRNRKLQHLDISYCGLKKDEVFEVVKACKKSRSLLAIHLTGNLLTDQTKEKIREYMRPRKRVKDIYEMIDEPEEYCEKKVFRIGNIDFTKALQAKLNQISQDQMNQNNGNKNFGNDNPKANPGENLIFSRILNHFEIPRSYRWQECSECWICQRHRYTVILMSKSIAENCFIQPHNKDRENFKQKISQAQDRSLDQKRHGGDNCGSDDDEIYYDADCDEEKNQNWLNNKVCSTFNRWKAQSVLPLGEFMKRLRKNKEPSVKVIQIDKDMYERQVQEYRDKIAQKQMQKKSLKRMNLILIKNREIKFEEQIDSEWYQKFTELDHENVKVSWLYELQSLIPDFENANIVIPFETLKQLNTKSDLGLKEKIYAFADYLPPGKHNTCFLYSTVNKPKKGLYTFLANVHHRQLPLSLYSKRVKEYRITRKFDKPNSMFKDFIEDNPAFLKKMFLKDIETWKLGRVLKDNLELRRLIDILLLYVEKMKDVFTYCIALSSFPSISWIDFGNFCNQWKIPDNRTCTMQTIDRVFIATNVELVEQEDNPDRDLCRFEFFEIICRLGAAKYKDSGVVSTWDAASQMILENNILPKTQVMGSQSFRDQYIWNLPIDDLFRANLNSLQILHNKYSADIKQNLNIDRCLQMMESLQLLDTEVKQAYAFSKMTIPDEMNMKDRYDHMVLSELMDFICRCAFLKYQGMTTISFVEKVERVLDILFKQIGCRRERPNFEIEVSSDSDYESDD